MSEQVNNSAPVSVESVESVESTESVDSQALESSAPVEQPADGSGIRKFKVKVNGTEMEVTEDELVQGYQTRKAADEKFREAAMTRKQAEEFVRLLKSDPLKVLTNENLGINFKEIAEQYLIQQLEEEMMDPKDRELRQYKAKLQAIEAERRQAEEREQEQRRQELQQSQAQNIQNSIIEALSSTGLPKTEHSVKRIAYYLHQDMVRGGGTLTAADAAQLVKQDLLNEQKSLYSQLDGDALLQLLGNDILTKAQKAQLSKMKKQAPAPIKQPEPKKESSPKSKKTSMDDWKARLERIKSGLE